MNFLSNAEFGVTMSNVPRPDEIDLHRIEWVKQRCSDTLTLLNMLLWNQCLFR